MVKIKVNFYTQYKKKFWSTKLLLSNFIIDSKIHWKTFPHQPLIRKETSQDCVFKSTLPNSPLFHLGLVLPDDEPEPVHGDGDDGQGGHEGGQAG